MKLTFQYIIAFLLISAMLQAIGVASQDPILIHFTEAEQAMILNHGPWPPKLVNDPSNRFSGKQDAIALGRQLFSDSRLSAEGKMSCASCHDSEKGFTDGLPTGKGILPLFRNTTSVFNLRWNRWFGWGGANDNLWAQSVRPIIMSSEMAGSQEGVAKLLRQEPNYACWLNKLVEENFAMLSDETLFIFAGKALAAYLETLITKETEFDRFRNALEAGDLKKAAHYPLSAQRGLKIFVGRGQCSVCHFGPLFTNGEFGDIGIPYFIQGGVDRGRYGGLQSLKQNPYNLLGDFNDDPMKKNATKTRFVTLKHRNWGEFRIPSLRNITLTAPYTHNGSLTTLKDVVLHYSDLNLDRLHTSGESLLKPLKLSEQSIQDIVNFMKTLTAPIAPFPYKKGQSSCEVS